MNFRSDCFIFIILSIILKITSIEGDENEFEICEHLPADLETVIATVYFNGCTPSSNYLFSQMCTSISGFTNDVLSLTLKAGANVIYEDDDYSCYSNGEVHDCTCTFQHACLSQLLDQAAFLSFICCTMEDDKTLEDCVTEFGMDECLEACLNYQTDIDPINIALDNAQEIVDKGVDLYEVGEPFTLFTETYDYCIDDEAYHWWTKSVCAQFTEEIFDELGNCE